MQEQGFVSNLGSTVEVAKWAYGETHRMQGFAWIKTRRQTERVDQEYLALFGAG